MKSPHVFSASRVCGDKVVSSQGESLGQIGAFGGFLDIGDKLFAVPWRALRLDGERK